METSYLFTPLCYWILVLLQRDCGVLVRARGIVKRVIKTGSDKKFGMSSKLTTSQRVLKSSNNRHAYAKIRVTQTAFSHLPVT